VGTWCPLMTLVVVPNLAADGTRGSENLDGRERFIKDLAKMIARDLRGRGLAPRQ
jgi:hypothetical protein